MNDYVSLQLLTFHLDYNTAYTFWIGRYKSLSLLLLLLLLLLVLLLLLLVLSYIIISDT